MLFLEKTLGISIRKLFACIMIGVSSFFCLAGYEFVRSVTSPLFIKYYGKDNLSTLMFFVPLVTLLLIFLYGFLLNWGGPKKAIVISSLFTGLFMYACQFMLSKDIGVASIFLFLFRAAYIVIIIEQYWSFVNSILNTKQALIVNGMVLAISTAGAILGGIFASSFIKLHGSASCITIAALSMLPTAIAAWFAYHLIRKSEEELEEVSKDAGNKKKVDPAGIKLLLSSSYLGKIALMIFFSQVMAGVLNLRFWDIAVKAIAKTDQQSIYYAKLYVFINTFSFINQIVIIPVLGVLLSRKYLTLKHILLIVPVFNFIAAGVLLVHPTLFVASIALIVFKVQDYSFFRSSKEPLYIPLSFDERYRSKQVIDSFIYRFAKGGFGGAMSLYKAILSKMISKSFLGSFLGTSYGVIALITSGAWFFTVTSISKQYRKLTQSEENKES